jgi:hypothetical protein
MSDNEEVAFGKLVEGFTTEDVDEGDEVLCIFALIKVRDLDGDDQWAVRSGGEHVSSEEVLGALRGLAASIERDLAEEWEW